MLFFPCHVTGTTKSKLSHILEIVNNLSVERIHESEGKVVEYRRGKAQTKCILHLLKHILYKVCLYISVKPFMFDSITLYHVKINFFTLQSYLR